MNTYTKEQREAWDGITGPGLYNIEGKQAYQYLCQRIKWELLDKSDPHTVLLIGSDAHKEAFLTKMIEEGVIDDITAAPEFRMYPDYAPDGKDPSDIVPRSLWSENDTEAFCNFIRNSKSNGYHNVAAVVLLGEDDGETHSNLKHVDKLLKIPVWRGSTLERNIELPVYSYNDFEAEGCEFSKVNNNTTPSGIKRTLVLTRADEVEPQSIEWLVPEFIPLHTPTVFSGQMAARKSTLAIDIAAALSCWRPWFMDKQGDHQAALIHHPPAITLFAGSEDRFESTVVPRYEAAGGNPDCLYNVGLQITCERKTNDGVETWETPFSLDEHLLLLREQIQHLNLNREWKVGLVIFDPLITMFGNKNYCSPMDANDMMIKVRTLCEEERVTVISIAHYNKTMGLVAKDKTSGAKRIVEAHRQAWGFDTADDSEVTIITPIKANLLAKPKSYKVTTIDRDGVGVIKFLGYTDVTADEQIESREDKGRGQQKEIKKDILSALEGGKLPPGHLYNQLRDLASLSSLKRAVAGLLEDGKITRLGTNPKNFELALATEAEQPTFDGVR